KDFLRLKLPEYMVPSHVTFLAALPLGSSGKLDRQALPAPEEADAPRGDAVPATPTERALAALWSEVLGVAHVSRDDDFFGRGGPSVLALKLLARIRDGLGRELPLSLLFECPRLAQLAARVDQGAGEEPWPPLRAEQRSGPLPLSFPQEQAWFMQQLEPGSLA